MKRQIPAIGSRGGMERKCNSYVTLDFYDGERDDR